jgi:hypothetical protein
MAVEKICIIAKTYPTLSRKYNELVCTAGVRADGSWVRLYPIPFRQLDYENQYHKFQWIEVDIERNLDDFSYVFTDVNGFSSKLQIIDWEIGMLYWNCLKNCHNDELAACESVRKKNIGMILSRQKMLI